MATQDTEKINEPTAVDHQVSDTLEIKQADVSDEAQGKNVWSDCSMTTIGLFLLIKVQIKLIHHHHHHHYLHQMRVKFMMNKSER